MITREISKEDFHNENYPLCRRCSNYSNARSSVFGDSWTCSKGHLYIDVDDNTFDIEITGIMKINDCGEYEYGEPIVYILG
jgi:hypothetical protein